MSVTPNFSWPLIQPTDFVTDLPADFEAFADDVDADVWALDQAAIKKTIVDAKGDIIAATAADTVARLAVGSNNQVLTADSATATGLKWATPATPTPPNFTLINAGGTALTGASTITISGLSGYYTYYVQIRGASATSPGSVISVGFNSVATNYVLDGWLYLSTPTTYSAGNLQATNGLTTSIPVGVIGNNQDGSVRGVVRVEGANTSGIKMVQSTGTGSEGSGTGNHIAYGIMGHWNNSATISSINIISSGGNFDAGTVFIYGA